MAEVTIRWFPAPIEARGWGFGSLTRASDLPRRQSTVHDEVSSSHPSTQHAHDPDPVRMRSWLGKFNLGRLRNTSRSAEFSDIPYQEHTVGRPSFTGYGLDKALMMTVLPLTPQPTCPLPTISPAESGTDVRTPRSYRPAKVGV